MNSQGDSLDIFESESPFDVGNRKKKNSLIVEPQHSNKGANKEKFPAEHAQNVNITITPEKSYNEGELNDLLGKISFGKIAKTLDVFDIIIFRRPFGKVHLTDRCSCSCFCLYSRTIPLNISSKWSVSSKSVCDNCLSYVPDLFDSCIIECLLLKYPGLELGELQGKLMDHFFRKLPAQGYIYEYDILNGYCQTMANIMRNMKDANGESIIRENHGLPIGIPIYVLPKHHNIRGYGQRVDQFAFRGTLPYSRLRCTNESCSAILVGRIVFQLCLFRPGRGIALVKDVKDGFRDPSIWTTSSYAFAFDGAPNPLSKFCEDSPVQDKADVVCEALESSTFKNSGSWIGRDLVKESTGVMLAGWGPINGLCNEIQHSTKYSRKE